MIHLQWETTASPEIDAASLAGDAVSPEGDLLASPNFGICDTTRWGQGYVSPSFDRTVELSLILTSSSLTLIFVFNQT